MNMTTTLDQSIEALGTTIVRKAMHAGAAIAKEKKLNLSHIQAYEKVLKERIRAGAQGIVAELRETDRSFLGDWKMVSLTLEVTTKHLAVMAWIDYSKTL